MITQQQQQLILAIESSHLDVYEKVDLYQRSEFMMPHGMNSVLSIINLTDADKKEIKQSSERHTFSSYHQFIDDIDSLSPPSSTRSASPPM